jgi:hypothetical protein
MTEKPNLLPPYKPFYKIKDEYIQNPKKEIWVEGVLMNFIYGLLNGILISLISLRYDFAVLLGFLCFYFFLGKIVNRPKYTTQLGKFIVFPVPTAIGAFTGYKLAPITIEFLQNYIN